MLCGPYQILFGQSDRRGSDGWCMEHAWETGELRTVFWWEHLAERDHLADLCVDGRIILKCILKTCDGNMD
jgi:hypothetical protein